MISRRRIVLGLGAGAFSPLACFAQAGKIWRVGVLAPLSLAEKIGNPSADAFEERLHELGYVQGKNLEFVYRFAEGKYERFPSLSEDLVRLKVDLILVASSTAAVHAVQKATKTIPIIFVGISDPVSSGFVASLSSPGGNITGVSNILGEIVLKRFELLSEILPKLRRVAILENPNNPANVATSIRAQEGAKKLGIQILALKAFDRDGIEQAFSAMSLQRSEALIVLGDIFFYSQRQQLVEKTIQGRLPTIFTGSDFVDVGGLMSWVNDGVEDYRKAAGFVDKILKGAKPADLPVEQPTKFELAVNVKTAGTLGLKFPNSILVRADKVVE